MRLIQLYDTFLSLGRLAVVIEIGRLAKKTEEQVQADLAKFCEMDDVVPQHYLDAKTLLGVDSNTSWPPGSVSEWFTIRQTLDRAVRSGDPRLEIFWRIANALGWTLWTPIPEGTEQLFREQLAELGVPAAEANDILIGLSSTEEHPRLESGEQIRTFIRSLSVSDEFRFLSSPDTSPNQPIPVTILPIFHRRTIVPQDDLVFVLMPFTEAWSQYIWKDEIQKIVGGYRRRKLHCQRAGDVFGHDVLIDIYESIARARIIIADITNRNSNVFYELGIAHTLGKDVILLSQGAHHIPFDLLRFRHCIYSNDGPGYKILREYLPSAIGSILGESG